MNVGFTGTRRGMTSEQYSVVKALLELWTGEDEAHSGDCVGSDEQFHEIARDTGLRTVGHPPDDDRWRAHCTYDEEREPRPYLVRNRDVVDESDGVIATPGEYSNVPRSGTWYTIRYTRKVRKPLVVVYPDGRTESS